MTSPIFSVVLYEPDIPWNTGAIGRTSVALGFELILIHPIGFSLEEKAIRRSGMDYWQHVQCKEYDNWEAFLEAEQAKREQLYFLEISDESKSYYDAEFQAGGYLVFGSETTGIPEDMLNQYADRCFELPMFSPHIRSLNLANTATAVAYEALRQIKEY